jgi:P-type Cu2+ transporter
VPRNGGPAFTGAASVGAGYTTGGAEACLATADVYLARPGLEPLVTLVEGSRRTVRVIRRNITFSIVYNIIGATLAITGTIDPLIAAVLMPASSLTVVLASWVSTTFPRERSA